MVIAVLTASIVLQLGAAWLAWRMVPLTRRVLAWQMVACALVLMAVRRGIALGEVLAGGQAADPANEAVGLLLSGLMFGGVWSLAPLFRGMVDAENQVREERDFSDAVLGTAGALVVVLDREGRIVRFNRACEQTTGYNLDEVRGRPFWEIFLVPEEMAGVMAVWGQLTAGQFPMAHENYWLTKDGGRRLISWANTCLTDSRGQVEYVIATGIDVTASREVEEQLRLDEARLQALLRLSEMAEAPLQEITDYALEQAVALTKSTLGYLAFMNEDETVLTMHSWSKTAMEQCAIIDKPIVYPVVNTGLWGEAVRQRRPVITNDYQTDSPLKKGYPEGHVRVLRHMNIPVFDGERIVAVAGVGNKEKEYDDSDVMQLRLLMDGMWRLLHRKEAQEALQRAHDELEMRIEQRTAELARSNAELEQFASVASHDLQEPLRKIIAFGDRLHDKAGDALSAESRDYLDRMQNAAHRMSGLINDMLAYSRVTTKAQPFRLVNLSEVAGEVMADLELAVEEAGAVIDVGELPAIEADPVQMRQLLQNLMTNALKFRREGVPLVVTVRARTLPGSPRDGHGG